jgi:chromosome segregation ATPase
MRLHALIALSLLILPHAQANFSELSGPKAWSFAQVGEEEATVCRAFTSVPELGFELLMDYPKDGRALPTITFTSREAAELISVKISRKESEPLFRLSAGTNEAPAVFWYAPLNFTRLEKLIRDQNSLEIFLDPNTDPRKIELSLAGSGDALRSVAKCLDKTKTPEAFFKALNGERQSLTPDLGDRSVAWLKQNTQEAFRAYLDGSNIKAALALLRKPVENLLRKEKSALDASAAADVAQERAGTRLSDARADVSSLELKIVSAQEKLAAFKTAKPIAEQDLATKKAAYLPLREQMKPFEAAIVSAKKAEDSFEAEIKKNEGVIAKNERSIRALESERSNLQRAIPGLESDAASLRVQYSQASSNYNAYNPSWERQRYLDNESRYRWAKNDISSKESELSRARSDYYSASSRADSLRSQVYTCRAQPEPNCSSLESDLSSAERERDEQQRKMNSLSSDISSLESDIRRYESDADSKVSSEQGRLRSERDSYASALSYKESELAQTRGRVEEIRGAIPGLRAQIERARGALPALKGKLADAKEAVAQAIAARDANAASIGFAAAKDAFEAAEQTLKETNYGIAENTKAIPTLEKQLVKAKRIVDPLVKALTKAGVAADAARAKLEIAREPLKGFREEERRLLASLKGAEQAFQSAQANYQALYAELVRL